MAKPSAFAASANCLRTIVYLCARIRPHLKQIKQQQQYYSGVDHTDKLCLLRARVWAPPPNHSGLQAPQSLLLQYTYIYILVWPPVGIHLYIYIYTHVPQRIHSQKYIHKTVPQRGTQVCIFTHTRGVGGRRPPPPWLIELGLLGL